MNSDQGKPEHCRKCKIKDCIREKSLSYCFECPEYPCRLIKNLEKSYNKRYQASLMENSEFVCQHGLEILMEQQKEKYTCPKCGGIISIHDRMLMCGKVSQEFDRQQPCYSVKIKGNYIENRWKT